MGHDDPRFRRHWLRDLPPQVKAADDADLIRDQPSRIEKFAVIVAALRTAFVLQTSRLFQRLRGIQWHSHSMPMAECRTTNEKPGFRAGLIASII